MKINSQFKDNNKLIIYSLALIIFALIFLFSYFEIWTNDSITYKYNFTNHQRLTSVWDIFSSQYTHYYVLNGRFVAHFICQLFLGFLGVIPFAICNALIYLAYIYIILKITGCSIIRNQHYVSAGFLILFITCDNYMPPFQVGYVWMPVLDLLFLYLLWKKSNESNILIRILLFFMSIIVGNGQEVYNIGIAGALVIYCLYNIKQITITQWYMIIGYAIGCLFLCLSPASINRGLGQNIPLLYSIIEVIWGLRAFYILLFLIIYKIITHKLTLREIYIKNAFYFNVIFILFVFNLLIGVGGSNQLNGIELFSSVIILRILKDWTFNKPTLIAAYILLIFIYYNRAETLKVSIDSYNKLYEEIENRKSENVFFDIPDNCKYRFGVYFDYVVQSILREIENKYDINESVRVFPKCIEKDIQNTDGESICNEINKSDYIIIFNRHQPTKFVLERNISFLGISIPIPNKILDSSMASTSFNSHYDVLYIPEAIPFIHNIRITEFEKE